MAAVKNSISTKFIKSPDKFAGMIVDDLVAAFEIVQFLEYRNRNNYIIIVKMAQRIAVMQNNIGIENENFFILRSGTHHVSPF